MSKTAKGITKYRFIIMKLCIKPSGMWRKELLIDQWPIRQIRFGSGLCCDFISFHTPPCSLCSCHIGTMYLFLKTLSSGIFLFVLTSAGTLFGQQCACPAHCYVSGLNSNVTALGGLSWLFFLRWFSPITLCKESCLFLSWYLR